MPTSAHRSYSSKSKSKKPRRSKSGDNLAAESDFEFVEFADLGTPLPPLRSPKLRGGATPDEKDWIFPLPLTLEELYHGVSQNYRITRTLRSGQTQSVKIHLRVSPSWQDGARVRVPGVGNERADGSFQDIVFVVEEQPHAAFARAGDDVLVSVQVPWADAPPRPYSSTSDATEDDADAFGEEAVYVRALGGREYSVPIPRSLVEAADGTRIVGAGMPVRKGGKLLGRGDLIIKCVYLHLVPTLDRRLTLRPDGSLRSRTPIRGSVSVGSSSRKLCTGNCDRRMLCYRCMLVGVYEWTFRHTTCSPPDRSGFSLGAFGRSCAGVVPPVPDRVSLANLTVYV